MLRWSAQETGRRVDLAGVVDAGIDPGLTGGRELAALGRAAAGNRVDRAPLDAAAAAIGAPAAFDAAAVAANFEIMNRVVDAVGLPVGRHRREEEREVIELLGLSAFPHAAG
ncbi:MAG: hypothetical protein LC733_05965 [Actinobacteria bacterium]|nr:hypothetical protein [Actinomycetota bacterium]